jgi:hypothetical protein
MRAVQRAVGSFRLSTPEVVRFLALDPASPG